MNVFIVDDEEDSREIIKFYLKEEFPEVKIVGEGSNGMDAINLISEAQIDVLFLDIELGDMNGFQVLEALGMVSFKVIFITAYDQYAIRAIKLDAIDYILKPIDRSEFVMAFDKVLTMVGKDEVIKRDVTRSSDRIALPTSTGYRLIGLEQLVRCEADDNYTRFFLNNGQHILVSKTLKTYEGRLTKDDRFVRIHSRHIVNTKYIVEYRRGRGGDVLLETGEQLSVSNARKKSLLSRLGLF